MPLLQTETIFSSDSHKQKVLLLERNHRDFSMVLIFEIHEENCNRQNLLRPFPISLGIFSLLPSPPCLPLHLPLPLSYPSCSFFLKDKISVFFLQQNGKYMIRVINTFLLFVSNQDKSSFKNLRENTTL